MDKLDRFIVFCLGFALLVMCALIITMMYYIITDPGRFS